MPKTAGFELGSGENNDRARYVMIHILSPTIIMARKGKNNQNNAAAAPPPEEPTAADDAPAPEPRPPVEVLYCAGFSVPLTR